MLEGSGLECDPTLPGLGWRRRTVFGSGLRRRRVLARCVGDGLLLDAAPLLEVDYLTVSNVPS